MTNLLAGIGSFAVGVCCSVAIGRAIDFCRLVRESFGKIEQLERDQSRNDWAFFAVRGRLKTLEDKMAELVEGEAD